jgi:hypothetical protein
MKKLLSFILYFYKLTSFHDLYPSVRHQVSKDQIFIRIKYLLTFNN